jgi:hypothetical protein
VRQASSLRALASTSSVTSALCGAVTSSPATTCSEMETPGWRRVESGHPKWMVFSGENPKIKGDNLGVPLFQETSSYWSNRKSGSSPNQEFEPENSWIWAETKLRTPYLTGKIWTFSMSKCASSLVVSHMKWGIVYHGKRVKPLWASETGLKCHL